MEEITLTVTLEELQLIGNALANLAYKDSVDILNNLQSQINLQTTPQILEELEEE